MRAAMQGHFGDSQGELTSYLRDPFERLDPTTQKSKGMARSGG